MIRRKIRSFFSLLKQGKLGAIFQKISVRFVRCVYKIRAWIEDCRIGGISVEKIKPTKFAELGATHSQSTHYHMLDRAFKSVKLKEDDVFLDVGCGEGRVLTYLYLRGYRNKMIGIELDPDIADTAKARTSKCANIEVVCDNILNRADLIKNATAVYLYNPFDETVLAPFIQMIEEHCDHKLTVYYMNDVHRKLLDKRENWYVARRDYVKSLHYSLWFPYTIYRYIPEK